MRDRGHELTDELLEKMEKKIRKEYQQAVKDVQEKLDDYLRRFAVKDELWRKNVENGKKTAEEYKKWRMGQIMVGKRWEEMRDTLAQDLHNANAVARSVIEGYRPEVYAINHNFATYEVEMGSKLDTSYTLYNRQAVERIMREDPDLLPPPGRKMKASLVAGKDIAWQEGQIQSVTMQSILQGESIPSMAKRIAQTMGETNHKATIRYARTAVTGAENAGRRDAFERAERMGIDMEQEWRATLDMRTRHSHRQLDGERRPVGEAFSNGCEYPGDPSGPAEEIWNCRCSIRGIVAGLEPQARKLRSLEGIEGMSYDEWRESHVEKPHRITKQEEIAEIMRRKYIREDYGGGQSGAKRETASPPVNRFGERVIFSDKLSGPSWNKAKTLVEELTSEFSTKLKEVRPGAHQSAGSVQISGTIMQISSAQANVVLHEFAHTISIEQQTKLGLYDEKGFWKEIRAVQRQYKKATRDDPSRWISAYEHSQRGADEFMAEAFTQAMLAEKSMELPKKYGHDLKYSKQVLEIIRNHFGKR